MTIASGEDLKILFERVRDLSSQAALLGQKGGQAATALAKAEQDAGLTAGAAIDPRVLASLPDTARESLHTTLLGLVSALEAALREEGPRDPDSVMFNEYASNGWVYALVGLGGLGSVLTLVWVCSIWSDATVGVGRPAAAARPSASVQVAPQAGVTPTSSPAVSVQAASAPAAAARAEATPMTSPTATSVPSEVTLLQAVIALGALGGFLHWTSSLAQFIGNRALRRSWIPYYLLMPIEGAALAPIAYLLLRVGVLSSGAGVGDLNILGLFAFSALTGLFSKQALSMLGDVFSIIFKKIQAKDGLSDQKKGSSSGSGTQP